MLLYFLLDIFTRLQFQIDIIQFIPKLLDQSFFPQELLLALSQLFILTDNFLLKLLFSYLMHIISRFQFSNSLLMFTILLDQFLQLDIIIFQTFKILQNLVRF